MKRHYFVDYEVLCEGRATFWGTLALTWEVNAPETFAPAALVDHIRRLAGERHTSAATAVRIRSLTRL